MFWDSAYRGTRYCFNNTIPTTTYIMYTHSKHEKIIYEDSSVCRGCTAFKKKEKKNFCIVLFFFFFTSGVIDLNFPYLERPNVCFLLLCLSLSLFLLFAAVSCRIVNRTMRTHHTLLLSLLLLYTCCWSM